MELRHLRYFIAAAEEENFNRAADRLNVAQPALSRQIRALEDQVGCQLFHRLKRGVAVTPAGRSLIEDARQLLAGLQTACEKALAIDHGTTGRLRIGTNAIAFSNVAVTTAIDRFRRQYAQVDIELSPLTSPEQIEAIKEDRLDAGLLYLRKPIEGFASMMLSDYTLLVGLRHDHPLARRPQLSMLDLRDEPFIWGNPGAMSFMYDGMLEQCRALGFEPRIVQRCLGADATLGLIAAGVGISFVHSSTTDRPYPDVVVRALTDFRPSLPLYLAWRAECGSVPLLRFKAILTNLVDAGGGGNA
jgi:LysR family transcriptional regulator, benzoate and cis,cis-muconate-responsive activator of ben and cat genes